MARRASLRRPFALPRRALIEVSDQVPRRPSIFISHKHADREMATELRKFVDRTSQRGSPFSSRPIRLPREQVWANP